MTQERTTLIYPSRFARLLRTEPGGVIAPAGRWAYLGRDFEAMARWTTVFGGIEPLDVSDSFRKLTLEHRRAFLDWIAMLGVSEANELQWYSSRIHEQNPLVDKLYHRCCLHLTGMALCARKEPEDTAAQKPLTIVCEDADVFRSLREALPLTRIRWPFVPAPALLEWALAKAKFIAKTALHLGNAFRDQRLSKASMRRVPTIGAALFTTPDTGGHQRILVHSCMDPSMLTTGRDRYLTTLPSRLHALGHTVILLPWIYVDGGRREAFYEWFELHPERFVLPDALYTIGDYLWSVGQVWSLGRIPRQAPTFLGQPAHHWLRRSRLQQGHDLALATFLRYYRLAERLRKAGAGFDVFVDTFENMVTEKPMVLGLRRWLPEVRTIGYQHWASPAPLMLCNFVSLLDTRNPLPDRIITYSSFTRDIFLREGYEAERLVAGPSLRYADPPLPIRLPTEQLIGLVVLPLEMTQAIATLRAYRQGLDRCPPEIRRVVHSRIKPHPMTSDAEWNRIVRLAQLPIQRFERVSGSLQQQLEEAHFAVSAASTAVIEIVMSGRPLVQLTTWMELELDSLAWFGDQFPTISGVNELAEAITRICHAEPSYFEHCNKVGHDLYARCIAPVTDDAVRLFLS